MIVQDYFLSTWSLKGFEISMNLWLACPSGRLVCLCSPVFCLLVFCVREPVATSEHAFLK